MSEKPNNKTIMHFLPLILKALVISCLVLTVVGVVQALNILANPNFDTSLVSWSTFITTWDGSQSASRWPFSGSAKSVNNSLPPQCFNVIWQCLNNVRSGLQYDFGGQIYIPASQTPSGRGRVTAQWSSGSTCATDPQRLLSTNTAAPVESSTSAGVWATTSITAVTAPSGTVTVLLSGVNCEDTAGNFQVNFDNMFLQTSPSDVSIAKTVVPTSIQPGQLLSYTLTFSNTGLGTGTGIVITDVLPAQLASLNYQASLPVTTTGNLSYTWQLPDLSPGMSGTITVTGIVSTSLGELPLIITNTATITTTAFDTNGLNNSSAVSITLKPYVTYLPLILTN